MHIQSSYNGTHVIEGIKEQVLFLFSTIVFNFKLCIHVYFSNHLQSTKLTNAAYLIWQSPADICGKIEEGDEVVQVNYQTVVSGSNFQNSLFPAINDK